MHWKAPRAFFFCGSECVALDRARCAKEIQQRGVDLVWTFLLNVMTDSIEQYGSFEPGYRNRKLFELLLAGGPTDNVVLFAGDKKRGLVDHCPCPRRQQFPVVIDVLRKPLFRSCAAM